MTRNGLPPRFRSARFRTALIAGVVALALSAAGVAAVSATVSAATDPGTPDSSARAEGHGRHGGFGFRNALHGEFVVERDGSTVTMVIQRGAIEAVSDSSVTVRSTDGFSQSYTLNADTEIRKVAEASADGAFQRPADATAADLAVGDEVRVAGTKDGSILTAVHVRAGDLPEPGKRHSKKHGEKRGGGFDGHRGHGGFDGHRGHGFGHRP